MCIFLLQTLRETKNLLKHMKSIKNTQHSTLTPLEMLQRKVSDESLVYKILLIEYHLYNQGESKTHDYYYHLSYYATIENLLLSSCIPLLSLRYRS